jgi:predicted secreted protein
MTIISGGALRLAIGDGNIPTENFHLLQGATLHRLEISQEPINGTAIAADAWAVAVTGTRRRLSIECEAVAYEHEAADLLRTAALAGSAVNMRLDISAGEQWSGSVMVTQYRETGSADDAKRIYCRLASATAITAGAA